MPTNTKLHLRIASPCRAAWENMDGDERVRFCRECSRNVYNLSAMTTHEARRVVAEREGRLCVRFFRRRDGTVLTSDCPVGAKRSVLRAGAGTVLALAGIAAGVTTVSACDSSRIDDVRMGEPQMATDPVGGDLDAGVVEQDEQERSEGFVMGDIALPSEQPLMGKVAAPTRD